MAIEPDDSEYGGQTVTGAAWPNVNEDALAIAATSFESLESALRDKVIPAAQKQLMRLSDSWEGTGARAALDEASAIVDMHEANAEAAKDTAAKLRIMEASVVKTKNAVNRTAEDVQRDCEKLNNTNLRGDVREIRIADRIASGLEENVDIVSANTRELAANLGVPLGTPAADGKMPAAPPPEVSDSPNGQFGVRTRSVDYQPPVAAVPTPSDGQFGVRTRSVDYQPPVAAVPTPSDGQFGGRTRSVDDPPPPAPPVVDQTAPVAPGGASAPAPSTTSATGGLGGARGSPARGAGVGSPGSQSGPSTATPSSTPVSPAESPGGLVGGDAAKAGAGAIGPSSPFDAAARVAMGAPMPANAPLQAPAPASAPTPTAAPTPGPSSPSATTPAPGPSGGVTGGGGSAAPSASAGAGPVGGGGPVPPPMPLGPPSTPPPAAPVAPGAGPAGPIGPGVAPASVSGTAGAVGPPAPVPVSAARARREAVAAAATAGALRRQSGGADPLQLAHRVGAALNADDVGHVGFGFFWVTGVTTDGTIIVANSYGLGYIPDGVNLPEQVRMATSDESIPVGERGRWATYPILALLGWAQHHGKTLRAVVATREQFDSFDPGAPRRYIEPDDIPASGKMQGRNRLEVIAPEAAARLAAVSDAGLTELLPPAPADPEPPTDESHTLWWEATKRLMSTSTARVEAHLQAFVNYANHAQELALYRAHTAADPVEQRAAVADWVYWQHLSVLISDSLASSASS